MEMECASTQFYADDDLDRCLRPSGASPTWAASRSPPACGALDVAQPRDGRGRHHTGRSRGAEAFAAMEASGRCPPLAAQPPQVAPDGGQHCCADALPQTQLYEDGLNLDGQELELDHYMGLQADPGSPGHRSVPGSPDTERRFFSKAGLTSPFVTKRDLWKAGDRCAAEDVMLATQMYEEDEVHAAPEPTVAPDRFEAKRYGADPDKAEELPPLGRAQAEEVLATQWYAETEEAADAQEAGAKGDELLELLETQFYCTQLPSEFCATAAAAPEGCVKACQAEPLTNEPRAAERQPWAAAVPQARPALLEVHEMLATQCYCTPSPDAASAPSTPVAAAAGAAPAGQVQGRANPIALAERPELDDVLETQWYCAASPDTAAEPAAAAAATRVEDDGEMRKLEAGRSTAATPSYAALGHMHAWAAAEEKVAKGAKDHDVLETQWYCAPSPDSAAEPASAATTRVEDIGEMEELAMTQPYEEVAAAPASPVPGLSSSALVQATRTGPDVSPSSSASASPSPSSPATTHHGGGATSGAFSTSTATSLSGFAGRSSQPPLAPAPATPPAPLARRGEAAVAPPGRLQAEVQPGCGVIVGGGKAFSAGPRGTATKAEALQGTSAAAASELCAARAARSGAQGVAVDRGGAARGHSPLAGRSKAAPVAERRPWWLEAASEAGATAAGEPRASSAWIPTPARSPTRPAFEPRPSAPRAAVAVHWLDAVEGAARQTRATGALGLLLGARGGSATGLAASGSACWEAEASPEPAARASPGEPATVESSARGPACELHYGGPAAPAAAGAGPALGATGAGLRGQRSWRQGVLRPPTVPWEVDLTQPASPPRKRRRLQGKQPVASAEAPEAAFAGGVMVPSRRRGSTEARPRPERRLRLAGWGRSWGLWRAGGGAPPVLRRLWHRAGRQVPPDAGDSLGRQGG